MQENYVVFFVVCENGSLEGEQNEKNVILFISHLEQGRALQSPKVEFGKG